MRESRKVKPRLWTDVSLPLCSRWRVGIHSWRWARALGGRKAAGARVRPPAGWVWLEFWSRDTSHFQSRRRCVVQRGGCSDKRSTIANPRWTLGGGGENEHGSAQLGLALVGPSSHPASLSFAPGIMLAWQEKWNEAQKRQRRRLTRNVMTNE